MAWTGATVNQHEPDPGNDGIWFMGFKVTNPTAGVWHYEYALYNQNLDRAIQSFSVPLGPGVNISNIGFHAPLQHPGWAHDGTFREMPGYSSTPWNVTQDASSITWSTETFAQNQNANAIRFGTLYNFRFDADQPPNPTNATVGFFKTGSPMPVVVKLPGMCRRRPLRQHLQPVRRPRRLATPTPTPAPCAGLTITQIGGSIVPGATDIGNHGDDRHHRIASAASFHRRTTTTLHRRSMCRRTAMRSSRARIPTFTNVNACRGPATTTPSTRTGTTCAPMQTLAARLTLAARVASLRRYQWHCAESHLQHRVARASISAAPVSTANFELRLYEGQMSLRRDLRHSRSAATASATPECSETTPVLLEYFCNGSGGPAYWRNGPTVQQVRLARRQQLLQLQLLPRQQRRHRHQRLSEVPHLLQHQPPRLLRQPRPLQHRQLQLLQHQHLLGTPTPRPTLHHGLAHCQGFVRLRRRDPESNR